MFASIWVSALSLIFLTAASSNHQAFGYNCSANGKTIIAHYTEEGRDIYTLNSLTIEGQDYKSDARLSVAHGSAKFVIENFRNQKRLMLKMGGVNMYKLGENGKVYQMLCYPIRSSEDGHSNDQL